MTPQHQAASRMGLFTDIDRMDAHAWATRLSPDAVMRFGNADPVQGRDRCRDALAGFYAQIDGLHHEVIEQWEHGASTIVEANVTYMRQDGREVTVPAVTIYRTDDQDLISDYRVYIDLAPVFAELG
jgi:ketosteroid isomerase-like protein